MIDEKYYDVRVTIDHVRAAGYCASGVSRVLDRIGLNERDFLENGCTVRCLVSAVNPMVQRVIDISIQEAKRHGEV